MNTSIKSFQKIHKRKSSDHYDTGDSAKQTSANKRKKGCYSSERNMKRNWEQE